MFSIEISNPLGMEGEFNVATPVVALDLALRAQQCGLVWRVSEAGRTSGLTLQDLRDRADAHVADRPGESLLLHEIDLRHGLAARNRLN